MSHYPHQHEEKGRPCRSSSRRGRIIVIARDVDDLPGDVSAATSRSITVVANFYEAMGELATTDIRTAPDVVVARSGEFSNRAGEFADALRKIDPAVALIAIGQNDDHDHPIVSPFVDAVLEQPVSRLDFERAVQTAGMVRTGPLVSDRDNSPSEVSHTQAPEQSKTGPPDDDEQQSSITNETQASERPASLTPELQQENTLPDTAIQSSGNIISDRDLIDRVLYDPGSVTAILELAVMSRVNTPAAVTITDDPQCLINDNTTPIMYEGQCLGSLSIDNLTPDQRAQWAQWVAPWLALARQTETWRRQAYTDDLTGAGNRRYFDAIFRDTLAHALDKRECVTLLIFDIDDFKHFNDSFGHSAGDEILIETIRLLKSVIRPKDVVCRVGGDEFAVIFYDASGERQPGSKHPENIARITERFQQKIAQHQFPKLGPEAPGRLTISGGLATFPWDGHDAESLYERADQALLAAKRSGKNAIILGPGT